MPQEMAEETCFQLIENHRCSQLLLLLLLLAFPETIIAAMKLRVVMMLDPMGCA